MMSNYTKKVETNFADTVYAYVYLDGESKGSKWIDTGPFHGNWNLESRLKKGHKWADERIAILERLETAKTNA